MAKTTIGVKLDGQTRERLRLLAEVRRRSPHWLMIEAIERYLDLEERLEQEKRADTERWERYGATGEHVAHADMLDFLSTLEADALRAAEVEHE